MAASKKTIPPERFKFNCNTSVETLRNFFDESLTTGNFPDNLKLADFNLAFKKKDLLNKELQSSQCLA